MHHNALSRVQPFSLKPGRLVNDLLINLSIVDCIYVYIRAIVATMIVCIVVGIDGTM